jgi:hypothetical protein
VGIKNGGDFMHKQTLITEVSARLNQMGVNYQIGIGSDMVVNCEFLDAGWNTGNKKITYEASAFFDETKNTVFLWEFTKEIGSGFSFGGANESSFQMGKTLFRKVKSVQYGPDGKAYEYNPDLGAIPKAFKEIAKQCGWKFKTVLGRDKASYPQGYIPSNISDRNQQGPNQMSQQAPTAFTNNRPPEQVKGQSYQTVAAAPPFYPQQASAPPKQYK